jgi:hypothetical protein
LQAWILTPWQASDVHCSVAFCVVDLNGWF